MPRRSHRTGPDDELGRDDGRRRHLPGADPPHPDRSLHASWRTAVRPNLDQFLMHGRERRAEVRRLGDVIEAHQRHVRRAHVRPEAASASSAPRPIWSLAANTPSISGARCSSSRMARAPSAADQWHSTASASGRLQPGLLQGRAPAFASFARLPPGQRPGQNSDALAALRDHVLHGLPRAQSIVHRHHHDARHRRHAQEHDRRQLPHLFVRQPAVVLAHLRNGPDDAVHAPREQRVQYALMIVVLRFLHQAQEERVAQFLRCCSMPITVRDGPK